MFTKTLATVAALAALGFAASSYAASPSSFDPDSISMKVKIADLNLSSRAGATVALQRIHQAAKAICGDEPPVKVLAGGVEYRACMSSVTNRAVASLANPYVTAMNSGHGKGDTILASNRH